MASDSGQPQGSTCTALQRVSSSVSIAEPEPEVFDFSQFGMDSRVLVDANGMPLLSSLPAIMERLESDLFHWRSEGVLLLARIAEHIEGEGGLVFGEFLRKTGAFELLIPILDDVSALNLLVSHFLLLSINVHSYTRHERVDLRAVSCTEPCTSLPKASALFLVCRWTSFCSNEPSWSLATPAPTRSTGTRGRREWRCAAPAPRSLHSFKPITLHLRAATNVPPLYVELPSLHKNSPVSSLGDG